MLRLEMTGAEVKQVLEDALSTIFDMGGGTGFYSYAAGLCFHVDASKTKHNRVSNAEINVRLVSGWSPIKMTPTYTVVTNDYIAGGKDGYLTFWRDSRS